MLLLWPRSWVRAAFVAVPAALLGCGGAQPEGGSGSASSSGSGGSEVNPCPAGQVPAPGGGCMAVGIPGCAQIFVAPDGLCHPSLGACPKGTIPKLDAGCIPVGIPGCAAPFVADGSCRPSPAACPAGTFPVPTEGCVPIDGPAGCGNPPWGGIAAAPGTVWVDPAAGPGGDGSQAKPVTTIAAALKLAPMGGTVALAAGDYDEAVYLSKPVQLVGRCASLVHLRGSASDPLNVVSVLNAKGIALRGVGIGGTGVGVAVLGAELELERVVVRAAGTFGVSVAGGSVTLTHSLVTDTQAPVGDLSEGKGVVAVMGGSVNLVASAVVANRAAGVFASDAGTTVHVTNSVVADTLPSQADKSGGGGVVLADGASGTLAKSAVIGNHLAGVSAADPGTQLVVDGSLLAATGVQASDGLQGVGLTVSVGAHATVHASALVDNHYAGAVVFASGAELSLDASLVAHTTVDTSQAAIAGVVVQDAAHATLTGTTVVDNASFGVFAEGKGARAELTQTLVAATTPLPDGSIGDGLAAYDGAVVSLASSAITGSHDAALLVTKDSTLTVNASLLADSAGLADGSAGFGAACNGSSLGVSHSAVLSHHTSGVLAGNCQLTVADSFIDDVLPGKFSTASPPATYDGISDGLVVAFGGKATATRLRVRRAKRAGVVFEGTAGTLAGVDASGGEYGLVAQGMPLPDWSDPRNVLRGGKQAILTDGALPVPTAPPAPK